MCAIRSDNHIIFVFTYLCLFVFVFMDPSFSSGSIVSFQKISTRDVAPHHSFLQLSPQTQIAMDGISDEDQSTEYEFSDDEGQQALEIVDEEEPPVVQGRAKKRSATAMPDIHFQYVTSKFGKRMLEYDGDTYTFSRRDGSQTTHWLCSKNHEGCKMQFETNDLNQCVGKSDGEHSHVTEKVDIEIRRIMTQIPVLARQSGDAARKIFARVMEGSSVEAKARITQHNVSRLVYYHRNSLESNMPCSPETLIIPEELKNYENEPFVVFDSGLGAIRLIAFSTARLCGYKEGTDFNRLVRMLKALVYVPVPDIVEAFVAVTAMCTWNPDGSHKFPVGTRERAFYDYFEKVWVGRMVNAVRCDPRFPISLWNCYELAKEGKAKTTNSLEAWHRAMRSNLATEDDSRPKFWKWIYGLRKECGIQEAHLINLESGGSMKLKQADKRRSIRVKNISVNYDRNNLRDYLQKHCYIVAIDDT